MPEPTTTLEGDDNDNLLHLRLTCPCGSISLFIPSPANPPLIFCHCASCRAQSGSAFGTSLPLATSLLFPLPPDLESKLAVFERPTDSGNTMRCYFCRACGVGCGMWLC